MMKVPDYRESQRFGSAPDARYAVDGRALSLASGGDTWGAVTQAGQQMRATSEQVGGMALAAMRQHNETVAMDRLNQAEAAILDMQAAQGKRLGGNALDSENGRQIGVSGTLRAGLDTLRATLIQGMNPAQQKLFDLAFTRRGQDVLRWGAAHEAQQREVYATSTEDGRKALDEQLILAHYQDPEQVSHALGNIQYVEQRRGRRLGLAPEAVEANVTRAMQTALLPMFDTMLDKGELGQAHNALKLFGPDLGAARAAEIWSRIRARAEARVARAEAARKKAEAEAEKTALKDAVNGILSAVADFPTLEEQKEAALARAEALPDPALRDTARAAIGREMAWRATRRDAADMQAALNFCREAQGLSPAQGRDLLDRSGLSEGAREVLAAWEKSGEEGDRPGPGPDGEAEADLRAMTLLRAIDQSRRRGAPLTADEVLAAGLRGSLSEGRMRLALAYLEDGGPLTVSRLDDICLDLRLPPDERGRVEAPAWLYEGVAEDLARHGLPGADKPLSDEDLASSVTRVGRRRETALAARGPRIERTAGVEGFGPYRGGAFLQPRLATPEALQERPPAPPPSWTDSFQHGVQGSVSGLWWRDKLPDILTPRDVEGLDWTGRLALSTGRMLGDAPTLLAGGGLGALGGPAAPVTVPAAAVGLTEGTRAVLENDIRYGTPQNGEEFAARMGDNLAATAKGMALGGLMGLAGLGAGTAVRVAGGGALAQSAGAVAAETATLPTAAAGMEGRLPEARDFADAAALILGMKGLGGAGKTAGRAMEAGKSALEARLRTIHEKTGIAPQRVARETRHDPALLDDLLKPGKPLPEPFTTEAAAVEPVYQAVLKEMYSDNRAVRMAFRDTGVEPSLADRGRLRGYLESLDPKEVKRLKLESSQEYLAVMKAITRKFFPREGELCFRRAEDGRALDYEHFVDRDTPRNEYLATLPDTLKAHDIRVEFTTAEGEAKAYLIRKYFDPDIQRDIWDMLVIRDGELKTKIARKDKVGRRYIESSVDRAGREASQPGTAGGATESASTPRDVT